MGETVVEPSLNLKKVLGRFEEVDVSLGEGLESLLSVCAGGRTSKCRSDPHDSGTCPKESGEHLSAHGHVCCAEEEEDVECGGKEEVANGLAGVATGRVRSTAEPVHPGPVLPRRLLAMNQTTLYNDLVFITLLPPYNSSLTVHGLSNIILLLHIQTQNETVGSKRTLV